MMQTTVKNDRETKRLVNEQKFRRNLTLLYLMSGFGAIHFFGGVLIPFFLDWGGITFAQTMILESIFTGGIFLLEIPTGTIADKYGRKKSMNLAFAINILAILVYVSYANFWIFALGELIWALSAALHSGAADAMIYDTLIALGQEQKSKKHYSRMSSVSLATMMIGSITGSWIANHFGLKATMTLSIIPLVITFGLSLGLKEPLQNHQDKDQSSWTIFKHGVKHLKAQKSLQRIIGDMILLSVIGYFGIWLYQLRLGDIGLDIQYFGWVHTGIIIMEIIMMNSVISLEKLFKSKKAVLVFNGIAISIGFLLTGTNTNIALNIIGFMLATGLGLNYRVISTNYMQKHIPSDQRATILSTGSMLRQFVIMASNPLVGIAGEWNMAVLLLILGGTALLWTVFSPIQEKDLLD